MYELGFEVESCCTVLTKGFEKLKEINYKE